jgi:UDP-N-acetylmuramoylalanine--D-glutamate ligase
MATIEAVKALGNVDTLIIGGMDRGIDYNGFAEYLNSSDISNIICMPKTGHDIAKRLKKEKVHIVDTLEEAVEVAKRITKKDKSCLLSPAAASYGFFKNFEEKGDLYKKLVRGI